MQTCNRRDLMAVGLRAAASLPALSLLGCAGTGAAPAGEGDDEECPTVTAGGGYGDIGHALGAQLRERHRSYLAVSRDFPTCLEFLAGSGRKQVERMLGHTRERFSHLVEELEGMADGMGLPFEQLFAHVCRSEIGVAARTPGCSTLAFRAGDRVVFAHNEDGNDRNAGRMYVARVRPPSGVTFRAFCYPALPPCNGPGLNSDGLVHTTNYIQPERTHDGIPRYFIGRAILEARTLDEALALATTGPRAFPWHHNLVSLAEGRMLSVEVMPDHYDVQEVDGPFVHTNHLVHPAMCAGDVPERDVPYESSLSRWRVLNERVAAEGAPRTPAEMLVLLSLHEGRPYSPCRHPQGDVHGATLGTLVCSGPPEEASLLLGNPCEGRPRAF